MMERIQIAFQISAILGMLIAAVWSLRHMVKKQLGFVDIIVNVDICFAESLRLSPENMIRAYQFEKKPRQRAIFRLGMMTASQYVPAMECSISPLLSPFPSKKILTERQKQIASFQNEIVAIIKCASENHPRSLSLPKQEIWRALMAELSVFGTANQKVLYLLSGLKEKSDIFHSDNPEDLQTLFNEPQVIAGRFVVAMPETNLSGITLRLRYAENKPDFKFFCAMANVYKQVLRSRGVNVITETIA